MLRFISTGESHGPVLIAVLDGFPAGLKLNFDELNRELKRRQHGYGRSSRQKIESDEVEFKGGVRHSITTGAPLAMQIKNRDYANWQFVMSANELLPSQLELKECSEQLSKKDIKQFRPGHADLAGLIKFKHKDIRDVLERASARETASRVAAGAVCRQLLEVCGIKIASYVLSVGQVKANFDLDFDKIDLDELNSLIYESEMFCPNKKASKSMIEAINQAWQDGDSLGGVIEVIVDGLPVGLGSYTQWDRKLDASLAQAVMSIQAVKAVEIGDGVESATKLGSSVHDALFESAPDSNLEKLPYRRVSNRAGGIEGGMSNGSRLRLKAYMKPIPTMRNGLASLSFPSFKEHRAHYERSDVCAVPAASVVVRSMVAIILASALIDKFSGDNMSDLLFSLERHRQWCSTLPEYLASEVDS